MRGRLDELVELNKSVVTDIVPRVRALENTRSYALGVAGAIGFISSFVGIKMGGS